MARDSAAVAPRAGHANRADSTYARVNVRYIQLDGRWRSRWPSGFWLACPWSSGPAATAAGRRRQAALAAWPRSSMATLSSSTTCASAWRASMRRKPARPASAGCSAPGPAAREATDALARLVEGKQVRCEPRGLDKYGRTLGVCFRRRPGCERLDGAPGACLGLRQVLHELCEGRGASARRSASASGRARRRRPGNIASSAGHSAEPQAPQGCAIKGNVTAHGKIYHMPWSPWYAQIRMDPDKGRRWFCTEAEAVAAGWRPVNVN